MVIAIIDRMCNMVLFVINMGKEYLHVLFYVPGNFQVIKIKPLQYSGYHFVLDEDMVCLHVQFYALESFLEAKIRFIFVEG